MSILLVGIFNKNICFIIPFIYIIHISPFHFLVKTKIDYIIHNWESLKQYSNKDFKPVYKEEEIDLIGLSNNMNINYNQLLLYFLDPISRIFFKIKNYFENPFNVQGLMILCLIINLFYLKFIHKVF